MIEELSTTGSDPTKGTPMDHAARLAVLETAYTLACERLSKYHIQAPDPDAIDWEVELNATNSANTTLNEFLVQATQKATRPIPMALIETLLAALKYGRQLGKFPAVPLGSLDPRKAGRMQAQRLFTQACADLAKLHAAKQRYGAVVAEVLPHATTLIFNPLTSLGGWQSPAYEPVVKPTKEAVIEHFFELRPKLVAIDPVPLPPGSIADSCDVRFFSLEDHTLVLLFIDDPHPLRS